MGDRVRVADDFISRFVGLLGTSSLPPGAGLLIYPSQGVHTLGMKFAIDVIFLDRGYRVLALRHSLKPFRMTALNFRAASVLELPSGVIEKTLTGVGDQLEIEDAQ